MNTSITLCMIQESHRIMKDIIQAVFEYEDEFKRGVLKNCEWDADFYTIEKCHIAQNFRITLKRVDCRTRDVYVPSYDVYDWFLTKNDSK